MLLGQPVAEADALSYAQLKPRLRGDRALHVEIARPALHPAQERLHDLGPRTDAIGEAGHLVEHLVNFGHNVFAINLDGL